MSGEADAVKVGSPNWELRAPCPCCGQGGLVFSTCPQCHHVLLICAEVGTVFPDAHDLSRTLRVPAKGDVRCPSCGGTSLRDYRKATSDEIRALGFTPNQYR